MCVCDFDMMFTFVYVDQEGTTTNACVFFNALTKPNVHFPCSSEGNIIWLILVILVHLDFYHHIEVNNITYKNIGIDVINLLGIENFLIIDIHPFKILLKGVLMF